MDLLKDYLNNSRGDFASAWGGFFFGKCWSVLGLSESYIGSLVGEILQLEATGLGGGLPETRGL